MSFGANLITAPGVGLGVGRPRPGRMPAIFNDFARYGFSDRVTFSRDSTVNGWTLDANGDPVLTEFAIDQPAFVIDPATGQRLGYRALAGFTNSLLYSDRLDNAEWVTNDSVVSADAESAPDGTVTADRITDDGSGGTLSPYIRQTGVSVNATTSYTLSAFLKKDTARWGRLRIAGAGLEGEAQAWFDLENGTVGTTQAEVDSADIKSVGNGWYRCILVFTTSPDTSIGVRIGMDDADNGSGTVTGDGTNSIFAWRAMLNEGSIAGPPIETEGSPVSTAADDATEPLPESCQDGFVWVVHARVPDSVGAVRAIGSVDDGDTADKAVLDVSNGTLRAYVSVDGVGNLFVFNITSVSEGDDIKVAFRVENGRFAACANGGAVSTDSTANFPNLNSKTIGKRVTDSSTYWNSTIALDYLDPDPSAWTDADLRAATS